MENSVGVDDKSVPARVAQSIYAPKNVHGLYHGPKHERRYSLAYVGNYDDSTMRPSRPDHFKPLTERKSSLKRCGPCHTYRVRCHSLSPCSLVHKILIIYIIAKFSYVFSNHM